MQQLEDRHARDFRFRPSEDSLPRRIGGLEISLGIERPEQIGTQLPGQATRLGALDHLPFEVGVQLAQPGFRPPEAPSSAAYLSVTSEPSTKIDVTVPDPSLIG